MHPNKTVFLTNIQFESLAYRDEIISKTLTEAFNNSSGWLRYDGLNSTNILCICSILMCVSGNIMIACACELLTPWSLICAPGLKTNSAACWGYLVLWVGSGLRWWRCRCLQHRCRHQRPLLWDWKSVDCHLREAPDDPHWRQTEENWGIRRHYRTGCFDPF